eukprot:TRINITY_DN1365_c0_g3_i1.p1 TRINITY_DN1365_c0_g3~~TRINITY_DN1365_c0_g3_i1.p1  ORF type:complete len:162 (+),score=45.80 TRINITY_DN1365_c0_g3_i1:67-552(+)
MEKNSVLFVCLGNICRSPMAELVFTQVAKERGVLKDWKIDSAATSDYHIGSPPDERSAAICKKHYPDLEVTHRGRQISTSDFNDFQYVFCMDESNLEDLKRVQKQCKEPTAVLKLFGSFDPKGERIIKDPYYGGIDGFQRNFDQCKRCSEAFLDSVHASSL